jgi:CheY-like chemotaxis protein
VLCGKELSYKGLTVSDIPRASTSVPQGTKPQATKILLVEDSLANRDMLTRRLQRRGFVVCSAADGPTGVAMSVSEKPDLILMDVALGAMDGWQATQLIKDDLRTSHIPIIALTAHALATDREKSVEVGCADFDTKPVDLRRLLGKIEVCLARTRR